MIATAKPHAAHESVTAPIERFRALITEHFGLVYEDDRLGWLTELLARRVRATGSLSDHHYLAVLTGKEGEAEWTQLAPELTVAETYFFRHIEQIDALRDRILPERLKKVGNSRPLRILSAGSASGEEAYTVAMVVASMPEGAAPEVRIDAIDINPVVLAKARAGRYRSWSLRETSDAMQQRWFTKAGQEYQINERIRSMVRFTQCNLADEGDPFWQPGTYDLIMCRNVLMYFSSPRMQMVLARFARSMAEGGYLMLGHAESLRGLTSDFRMRQSHGTFYYQLADKGSAHGRIGQGHEGDAAASAHAAGEPDATQWVKTIGQSAERVRALASLTPPARDKARGEPGMAASGGPATALPDTPFDEALALFEKERFQDALALIQSEPPLADDAEPWHQVLHALLLMHVGRLDEALALCRRELVGLPLQADLHHVLSLCLEAAGALQEATDIDLTASFLDPGFAMPHVHIGTMARRQGHDAVSRRAFSMAQRLLAHESTQRLRLFAGGFSREALRDLCRRGVAGRGDSR